MGTAFNSVHAPRELGLWEARTNVLSDYFELTKPRVNLTGPSLKKSLTTPGSESVDSLLLVNTLLGTGLLASGAAVLNQFMERKADSRMLRTANRPVASGRVAPSEALVFGMVLVSVGALYLLFFSNYLTAFLAGLLPLFISFFTLR